MKIALFGGRFDPIHNGHIAIAKEVLKVKAADEVWLSLENQHQWRPIVASIADRLTMVKLAIKGEKKIKIDLTPVRLGGLTETISVVRELRKHIHDPIIFVIGSDNMNVFHKWTHWKELEKEVKFLVIARKGSPIKKIPSNCTILDDPTYEPLEDSATRVREYIQMRKSISSLVPRKVEEYIKKHKLYV